MEKDNSISSQPMNTLAKGAVNGAGAFLGRICNPAAEEFGLLLRDKVRHWRNKNFIKIISETEELLKKRNTEKSPNVHPRVLHSIYENASWSEDEELQKMWAGLLTSSCFDEGSDKSIFYVDILSKISRNEAVLFNYICKLSEWRVSMPEKLVEAMPVFTEPNELKSITNINNFEDIEEAISHLQLLGLLTHEADLSKEKFESYDSTENNNFDWEMSGTDGLWRNYVELKLTSLGVRLFLKVQGIDKRPSEYFKDKVPATQDDDLYYND